jgi:hypothetical protein
MSDYKQKKLTRKQKEKTGHLSGLDAGAGYEIRTRDFHLGKVTLYH